MICLLHYFPLLSAGSLILPEITNHYEFKIDWGKTRGIFKKKKFLITLERCNTSSNVHPTDIKTVGDKKNRNPRVFLP